METEHDQAQEQAQPQAVQQKSNRPQAHLDPWKFKPGQSGNPGGRPSHAKLSARLQRWLDEGGEEKALQALVDVVSKGGPAALEALRILLDRTEGKVTQTHRIEAARPKRVILEGGTLRPAGDQELDQEHELPEPSESTGDA
jgi:hypothetical protein